MDEIYIGEIVPVAFGFAPRGWHICDGSLLAINTNQALFSLLGTMYGGDGITTFALPDLRGRAAVHAGQGPGLSYYAEGQKSGTETVTLTTASMPAHNHGASMPTSAAQGDTGTPATAAYPAMGTDSQGNTYNMYAPHDQTTTMPAVLNNNGGSQPHNNIQPSLVINYIIAMQGIYPSRP